MEQNSYLIGRINNTHGIKGAVKIQSFSDFNRFYVGASMYAVIDKKELVLQIEKCVTISKGYLVSFKGIDTVEKATMLKGKELFSHETCDEDELHFSDLLNLKVMLESGEDLGFISNVIDNNVQTVIEISRLNGKKLLLPFVKAHIKGIKQKKLVVYNVDGMFENEN